MASTLSTPTPKTEDMQNKYTRACRFPCRRGFLHKPSSSIDQRRAAALRPAVRRMFYSQARKVWRRRGPLINAQFNLPVLPRTPHRTFQAVFASQSASIVLGEFMHKSQRRKASSYAGVYEGARPPVTSLRIFWWLQTNLPPILRFQYSSPCQRGLRMISVTGKPPGKYGSPKEPLEWSREKNRCLIT